MAREGCIGANQSLNWRPHAEEKVKDPPQGPKFTFMHERLGTIFGYVPADRILAGIAFFVFKTDILELDV